MAARSAETIVPGIVGLSSRSRCGVRSALRLRARLPRRERCRRGGSRACAAPRRPGDQVRRGLLVRAVRPGRCARRDIGGHGHGRDRLATRLLAFLGAAAGPSRAPIRSGQTRLMDVRTATFTSVRQATHTAGVERAPRSSSPPIPGVHGRGHPSLRPVGKVNADGTRTVLRSRSECGGTAIPNRTMGSGAGEGIRTLDPLLGKHAGRGYHSAHRGSGVAAGWQ